MYRPEALPSDKGYRFYVESLEDAPEPPESLQRQIRDQFSSVQLDPEAWIQLAAAVLSRMVDNVAIVTIPREAASRVKHLQLVYVQEFLALLIVVLQEARLRQHLLPLEELTSQTELTETANRLNEQLSGHTYSEIAAKQLELDPFQDLVKENTIAMLKEVDNEAALEHSVDGLRAAVKPAGVRRGAQSPGLGRASGGAGPAEERPHGSPRPGRHSRVHRRGEPARGPEILQRGPEWIRRHQRTLGDHRGHRAYPHGVPHHHGRDQVPLGLHERSVNRGPRQVMAGPRESAPEERPWLKGTTTMSWAF